MGSGRLCKSAVCDLLAGIKVVTKDGTANLCIPCAATSNWLIDEDVSKVSFYADQAELLAAHAMEILARKQLPELKRDSSDKDEGDSWASLD